MEDDLDLPTLPQYEPSLPSAPPFLQPNNRKRSIRSYELLDEDMNLSTLHTSSDPALFSSDENPDAENYSGTRKRHKRRYKGTWWGEHCIQNRDRRGLPESTYTKRRFKRNFDSGIFMGSDDGNTEPSSDSSFGVELIEAQNAFSETTGKHQKHVGSEIRRKFTAHISHENALAHILERVPRSELIDPRQHQVRNMIRRCLEEGKEDVDLSGLALQDLPIDLTEMMTMVRVAAGTQEPHASIEAHPRLYLGNNLMRQFPPAVLDLTNLRLLSLRQNKLTSIPSGIRSLTNLQTLNISGNKLQYLPWDVLLLIRHHSLREINSEPNPWTQKEFFSACGDVSESRPNGLRLSGISIEKISQSKVPFLSEMVLRQLAKANTSRTNLTSLMPKDTSAQVLGMLDTLHTIQRGREQKCAVPECNREMIIPRWEWIEWWDVKSQRNTSEHNASAPSSTPRTRPEPQILPFMKRVCGQCSCRPND